MVVNVYEANTQLSKMLDRVAEGEEFILGKSGKPIARLVAYRKTTEPRKPGRLANKIHMTPGFRRNPRLAHRHLRTMNLLLDTTENLWSKDDGFEPVHMTPSHYPRGVTPSGP